MPRVVRLRQGASSSSLKLSAEESSFLAQVDGSLDEDELALMTGLTPDHVGELVDRLVLIGAIEAQDAEAARRTPPARPIIPTPPPSQPAASARSAAIAGAAGPPSSGPTSVDLDPAKRARIDALWGRIDEISYYEILGVAATADKKQVKSAYYGLAPEFHPDKFFRKQIGDYKHKIEAIFARITLAHDVLTVPARRAEYDAYLEQTRMNKSTAAVLEQPREDVEAILAAVERAAADAARAAMAKAGTPASAGPASVRTPGAPTVSTPPPSMPLERLSPDEVLRQRREALARKLAGGRPLGRPSGASPAMATGPDPTAAARAAEAVREHQRRALREAKRAQVMKYVDAGKVSLEAKDWASAANSYRIAASIDPDDPEIQAMCSEALQKVAAALADGYWKQGLYEEAQGRWGDAALSYSKVCSGRPNDAMAHDRVAQATIRSSTNFRRAVEFARRAIEIDPKRGEFHVTLAVAYAFAGMENSSSGELERALELGGREHKITALVNAARATIATAAKARTQGPSTTPTPPTGILSHGPGSLPPVSGVGSGSGAPGGPPGRPTSRSGEHSFSQGLNAPVAGTPSSPPMHPSPTPASGAPSVDPSVASPVPPRKESGIHAFVNAVRSALAPKEGK